MLEALVRRGAQIGLSEQERRFPMATQWEYLELDFVYDGVVTNARHNSMKRYISYVDFGQAETVNRSSTILDMVGRSGWELVSVIPIQDEGQPPNHMFRAFLKKPIE